MSISEHFDANAVVYGSQLHSWEKHNVISIVDWALDHPNPRRACATCDRWDGYYNGTTNTRARRATLETAVRPPGLLGRSVEEALTPAQTRWVAAMMELWRTNPWGKGRAAPVGAAAQLAGITEKRSRLYYYSPRYSSIRQEFDATRADDVRQGCHGCYASFFPQEFSPGETEARFQELVQGRQDWKDTVQALLDHEARAGQITHPRSIKVWKRERGILERKLKDLRERLLDLGHDPLKVAASGGLYV